MDPKLQDYLNTHPTEAQTILETLCRQPSIAAENLGMGEATDLVESLLSEAGFETQQLKVEGAPAAVFDEAGYSQFRRVAETPFNIVYEARA